MNEPRTPMSHHLNHQAITNPHIYFLLHQFITIHRHQRFITSRYGFECILNGDHLLINFVGKWSATCKILSYQLSSSNSFTSLIFFQLEWLSVMSQAPHPEISISKISCEFYAGLWEQKQHCTHQGYRICQ